MGISVSHIKNNTRSVDVPFGDETIHIVYRPSEWTPSIEKEWQDSEGSATENMLQFLSRLVIDWDIYEDDEETKKLPITPESLEVLPTQIGMGIIRAVSDDSTAGKDSRTSSSGTSRRRN